jgi:mono/diheme cytochrome c family protein
MSDANPTSDRNASYPSAPNRALAFWVLAIFALVAIGGGFALFAVHRYGAVAKANALKNPQPATAASVQNGQFLSGQHCLSCHGINADGKGERAATISVAPANLTDSAAIGRESDGLLFWKISEGHDPMPAYKNRLSESDRWDLVNYLRTLTNK